MSKQELEKIAQAMVAQGKGILAADESMGTIKRRFDSIKIESNENNRRGYREMLFGTKGLEEAISGVILFDETLRTAASDGTPFSQLLAKKSIMPGIGVLVVYGYSATSGIAFVRSRRSWDFPALGEPTMANCRAPSCSTTKKSRRPPLFF